VDALGVNCSFRSVVYRQGDDAGNRMRSRAIRERTRMHLTCISDWPLIIVTKGGVRAFKYIRDLSASEINDAYRMMI
jgi:hypothetical protein